MSNRTNQKPNGHAGPQGRVNGHGPASTEGGGIPVPRDQAASDDARGASDAMDASSIHAPGTDRGGCAEVAPPPSSEKSNGRGHASVEKLLKDENKKEQIPGGEFPLPPHSDEFVEEVHRRVDLLEVWQRLLNHGDPKVQQRAVEKLTEMRYKGATALADEPQQILFDLSLIHI